MQSDPVVGCLQGVFSGWEIHQQIRALSSRIQNGIAQLVLDRYIWASLI
jgi:hypothetical protein